MIMRLDLKLFFHPIEIFLRYFILVFPGGQVQVQPESVSFCVAQICVLFSLLRSELFNLLFSGLGLLTMRRIEQFSDLDPQMTGFEALSLFSEHLARLFR